MDKLAKIGKELRLQHLMDRDGFDAPVKAAAYDGARRRLSALQAQQEGHADRELRIPLQAAAPLHLTTPSL